ncbi:hypothetical protein LH442_10100 [Laribacter hongkongensis]|uniref:CheR family methyltransferase n=1 Tax=Laribacter hongkongensis TaxID=168471 RepID=UPI001EFEC7BE|nr:CheR family methyltransferase [Laribacter hongkongensis]MCG9056339.1 hypothetical protein [Laribacter hongkongensis]MCG9125575.1 hypothetical protein [Laribacter hongkongensis]
MSEIRTNLGKTGIPATSLIFRNPAQITFLVHVCKELIASKGNVRIKIFAESRGEEAFGLAIALDCAGLFDACELHASDVDPNLVAIAQTGVIDKRNFARLPDYARSYFSIDQGGFYTLRPAINNHIFHSVVDVLKPRQMNGSYDLICLQNLLCHLSTADQVTAINNVARCQRGGGYLALGGVQTAHLRSELIGLGYSPVDDCAQEIYEGWNIQIEAWFRSPRPYWALPPVDLARPLTEYATMFRLTGGS